MSDPVHPFDLAGGDGEALLMEAHPIEVTDAMIAAGDHGLTECDLLPADRTDMLRRIFIAMVRAAPPEPEISDDALEEAEIEFQFPYEMVEELAIKAAKGNNGGEWATHYTDTHKDYWRGYARDLLHSAIEMVRR